MTSSANFNRQSYVPYHSLSIDIKYVHALAHNSIAFSIQYYLTASQMLIVIAMPEMFQQCLHERELERVLYENLWCNCEQVPVIIDNEW